MTVESSGPIDALPPLREVIREHGLRAEKSLGQNFLLDLNLTRKIAKTARGLAQNAAFEIGPGPGGLTRGILVEGCPRLIAVEYDPRAIEALQGLVDASGGRLFLVQADALTADLPALGAAAGAVPPYAIVANLPYNIATPLLTGWLERWHGHADLFSEMVLMFQKEVAQRIVAQPSTKAYGRLSVLSQWLCRAKLVFDVPASAFVPPPKVTSSIVRLERRGDAVPAAFGRLEKITAAAFGQRRKMIRSSLKEYMAQVEQLGLDPTMRAEDIAPDDYARLAAES